MGNFYLLVHAEIADEMNESEQMQNKKKEQQTAQEI